MLFLAAGCSAKTKEKAKDALEATGNAAKSAAEDTKTNAKKAVEVGKTTVEKAKEEFSSPPPSNAPANDGRYAAPESQEKKP